MNLTNLDITIKLMEAARQKDTLDMEYWQNRIGSAYLAYNIEDLHSCGNKACLAGHIAISPEFKADGGTIIRWGSPAYLSKDGLVVDQEQYAIGRWLGIDDDLAGLLIYSVGGQFDRDDRTHPVYGTAWRDVQPKHVISALEELMKIGEVAFFSKYTVSIPPSCDAL